MTTSTMATLEEVKELLRKACPGADVDDVMEDESYRFTGAVRWDGFRGWSDQRRHEHIMREVRNPLGLRGIRIGPLYLLTSREKLD